MASQRLVPSSFLLCCRPLLGLCSHGHRKVPQFQVLCPDETMPRGRKRETYVFSYCFFIRLGRPFPEAVFSLMLFWPKWHPRLISRLVAGRAKVPVMTGHHVFPTREVCSLGTCWKKGVFCFILMIVDTAGLYRVGAGIGGVLQCARQSKQDKRRPHA